MTEGHHSPTTADHGHPNLVLFDHPLMRAKLTAIRDKDTGHRAFRALVSQIAGLMVYEVTRGFSTAPHRIETPIEPVTGDKLDQKITVVPVLRAGLGMTQGVLDLVPEARVGHLGLARDEETLEPKVYLERLPSDLDAGPVILVDPMLATGGSAVAAAELLKKAGATDLRLICLVAAPEGVRRLAAEFPGMPVYAAALDRQLDHRGFICPGLGDAGDRLFGTD